MPGIVIVGVQWGDEGKGKATDLLGERTDWVVKFNGGNNAGHTVVIGDEKYALHLLPSGILSPGVNAVIGNGVVVDLEVLFAELEALNARGLDTSRLKISANAHVITQYHRTLDKVTERFLGKRMIGTTGRGIGPTYADKINRVGIRIQDLFDENILRQKVEGALDQKNHLLVKVFNRRAITVDEVVDDLLSYVERLRPMVCDTGLLLSRALDAGDVVVFEGGQATMLDVDHGTYPFVTSSSATAGGASTGSGVGPNRLDRIVGIVKAYTTRVGSGPFPTELFDDKGEWLASAASSSARRRVGPAAWAGTTRRSRATRPASTASPTSCSPSSTSSPGSSRSPCASRTTSTASGSTRCRSTRATSTTRHRSSSTSRAGRTTSPARGASRICPSRRRSTCSLWKR